MHPPYKPQGVNTANVYLINKDLAALIHFVEQTFKAQVIEKVTRPGGCIAHAEIRIEDSTIMAGAASENFEECTAGIYVYVADCDAAYAKALEAGALSVMQPQTRHDEKERYGGVKDSNGNTWWIASWKK